MNCDAIELDPRYEDFFRCFNEGLYFEAHEVLEPLWLERRGSEDALFYKGLIQLAGAFVHVAKQRFSPALALFKLALANLAAYPARYKRLSVGKVTESIRYWIAETDALRIEKERPVLALEEQGI